MIPAWGMQRERGRDEVGCLVENTALDLAPKYLDLGLHLPCGNTQGFPKFLQQGRFL